LEECAVDASLVFAPKAKKSIKKIFIFAFVFGFIFQSASIMYRGIPRRQGYYVVLQKKNLMEPLSKIKFSKWQAWNSRGILVHKSHHETR